MKSTLKAAVSAALLALCVPAAPTVALAETGVVQSVSGVASWYGGRFHGRTTANGERYNMNALTAAHKSLPFGTRVRITNTDNGRTVIVRINDRGPYHGGRVIDLSRAAAIEIDMINAGTATVQLDILAG